MTLGTRNVLPSALAAAMLGIAALMTGCGGDDTARGRDGGGEARATLAPTGTGRGGPVPDSLRTVESAAEDTIDFALAGKRDKAVAAANDLKAAADGPAGTALASAGLSGTKIAAFRGRANEVARLAPKADLLRVALASNRAFERVPSFFALYESAVPADVLALDHLDFEAKLQARAGDNKALRAAVQRLDRTWAKLRSDFISAGGTAVAPRFDSHVRRMQRLVADGAATAENEAQRGLDLVDELEAVYAR